MIYKQNILGLGGVRFFMIEIPVSIFSEWYVHLPKCGREIIQSNGSIKEEQICSNFSST